MTGDLATVEIARQQVQLAVNPAACGRRLVSQPGGPAPGSAEGGDVRRAEPRGLCGGVVGLGLGVAFGLHPGHCLLGTSCCVRMPQVTVVDAGSWETTVASLPARNAPALLWARRPELAEQIAAARENPECLAVYGSEEVPWIGRGREPGRTRVSAWRGRAAIGDGHPTISVTLRRPPLPDICGWHDAGPGG